MTKSLQKIDEDEDFPERTPKEGEELTKGANTYWEKHGHKFPQAKKKDEKK